MLKINDRCTRIDKQKTHIHTYIYFIAIMIKPFRLIIFKYFFMNC